MRRLLILFIVIVINLLYFPFQTASADQCTPGNADCCPVTTIPSTVTAELTSFSINITGRNADDYNVKVDNDIISNGNNRGSVPRRFTMGPDGLTPTVDNLLTSRYGAGTHNVELLHIGGGHVCSGSFTVGPGTANGSGTCSIELLGNFTRTDTTALIVGPDSQGQSLPDGDYSIVVNEDNPNGHQDQRYDDTAAQLKIASELQPLNPGLYVVLIKPAGGIAGTIWDNSNILCSQYFRITPTCTEDPVACKLGGTQDLQDPNNPPPNPAPCTGAWTNGQGQTGSEGICSSVATGFGFDLPTDAPGFAKSIMGIVLGIAGGIALIIIIITGYRVLTSQGDPEKLKGARETLTSAIVGLLFIIFSLVILQIATVDILHIPGFCNKNDSSCQTQSTPKPTATPISQGNGKT